MGRERWGARETKATGRGVIHLSLVFINISHLQLTSSHAGGFSPLFVLPDFYLKQNMMTFQTSLNKGLKTRKEMLFSCQAVK